jgi:anti-sigma regulatory factor (Ser/Thr protein kinase)
MSGHRRRTVDLPCELRSVTEARHLVRDTLLAWHLPQLVDDAQLGVSELVANAVRHARTPLELTVALEDGVTIEVRDRQPELRRPTFGAHDVFAEGGRGLQLVSAVAQDWGIRARADGKVIWFVLKAPDASVPDAHLYALDGYRAAHETTSASVNLGARAHLG